MVNESSIVVADPSAQREAYVHFRPSPQAYQKLETLQCTVGGRKTSHWCNVALEM